MKKLLIMWPMNWVSLEWGFSMKFKSDYFNLLYTDEAGNKVRMRRRTDIRGFQTEFGKILSHTHVYLNYEYCRILSKEECENERPNK